MTPHPNGSGRPSLSPTIGRGALVPFAMVGEGLGMGVPFILIFILRDISKK